jgi:hypothetical protein
MNLDFGFIISTFICKDIHKSSLIRCIQSIQQFHPENKIIVIVDYKSDFNFFKDILETFPTVFFEFDCSTLNAENLPFTYFLRKKYFQKAII